MKKNIDVRNIVNLDPIIFDLKTKQTQFVSYAKVHWNIRQRLKMAAHWRRMYKTHRLVPAGYHMITVKYGRKILFTIGSSTLCGFIRGWMYYPHYVKFDKPNDVVHKPVISVNTDVIIETEPETDNEVTRMTKDVLKRIADLSDSHDIKDYKPYPEASVAPILKKDNK